MRFAVFGLLLLLPSGAAADLTFLWKEFPRHLWRDAKASYAGPNTLMLAGAGGFWTGTARTEDRPIQGAVLNHRYAGGADEAGNQLGMPYTQFGWVGLAYGAGRLCHRSDWVDTSEQMLESLSVATVSTHLLKVTVRRDRPDGSNALSFPSNHASGSFALAASVGLNQGWRWGAPSCLLASFVAYSRIQENKHFASDTVFGAALGINAAYATWKTHHHQEIKTTWQPLYEDGRWGLACSRRF